MITLILISQSNSWHLSVGIVGTYVKYKNEVALIKGNLSLSKKVSPVDYSFSLSSSYGTTDGSLTENSYMATAKADYYLTPKVEAFTLGEYMSDRIAQINARVLMGGGLKYVFYKGERGELSLSGALLYNYEHRDTVKQNLGRYSFRLKYRLIPNNFVEVFFIAFYQPSMKDFSNDYWIWGTLEVKSKLSENLFLKYTLSDRYENLTNPRNNLTMSLGVDYTRDF